MGWLLLLARFGATLSIKNFKRRAAAPFEAMVAAAATIAVVYPHMNSIGGDGFWLILKPNGEQIAIDASGACAQSLTIDSYLEKGLSKIPLRGPLAANTVAGTISGWDSALSIYCQFGRKKAT
jgi:gamma-glutamyltranspeptidase/glutathione hydrolase